MLMEQDFKVLLPPGLERRGDFSCFKHKKNVPAFCALWNIEEIRGNKMLLHWTRLRWDVQKCEITALSLYRTRSMCTLQCVKPILVCVVVGLWNVSRCVFCFCKELECHHKNFLTALVLGFALLSPLVQQDTVWKNAVTRSAIPITSSRHLQEQLCNSCSSGTPNQLNSGSTTAYTGSRKVWANHHRGNPVTVSKYREVISDSRIPWITNCERLRDDWVEVSWYVNPIIILPQASPFGHC